MERVTQYENSLTVQVMTSKGIAKRKSKLTQREKWYGFLFISPMVIGYVLFLLGPIIAALTMSFTNWSLIKEREFIGFANYKRAFFEDPVFWDTVWNSFYFTIVFVPLNIIVTLGLALLLKEKIRGINFFRTAIFTPVVTSVVVWAVVWKYIFQTDNGLINSILKLFGITGPAWLYDLSLAMPVIIFVTLLKGLGINMVIFLAALNEVPQMYYEAAQIDGASRWKVFRNVTLPLITPSVFLVVIITMIGSLKVFGQIYVLTGGGPGTSTYVFVYYIYSLAFKEYEFGYASAIAYIMFIIILILTMIQWNVRRKWVHHEQ
ncbi:carbohydrate ABC transporter permease [Paenibacillus alginolyticus]|uniref:Sugar ABC transporter permease n=1 Tax=Paenibacillus alginolyticus TaxID=59839 RepID=A0ABT4GQA6_9BACL|nr:sugar ABC transporter permease [Paenibacillus alginolyticus]MCY9698178.1 sugar ABC transporter permease [Paenibacillus alginolyticus]MEC0146724.1 sugar ABC transporter permease [Paenibacillus alginolyticus]